MRAESAPTPNVPARLDAYERLETHRAWIRRMVAVRLDRRLRGRVDPSDVVQDIFVEAVTRLPSYEAQEPSVSLSVWVRYLALQKIAEVHRHHLGRRKRDVRREARLAGRAREGDSEATVGTLAASGDSPSVLLAQREHALRLRTALARLGDSDREVLGLRHFEGLTNQEVAQRLELSEPAASLRYARALQRLGRALRTLAEPNHGMNSA
ncbi:MAG: sigma-70 family RNA polymerase sigma factor [Planctomycetota bacterium]